MKFLIFNYCTNWSTQPLYLNASLNMLSDHAVHSQIYDTNMSLYDNFDTYNPNIVITKYSFLSQELLSYLSENKNIQLVVNVDGVDAESIKILHDKIKSINIDVLFFGNNPIDSIKDVNYIKLPEAADIFLQSSQKKFSINKLIFVRNVSEIVEIDGTTYHYTSDNLELKDNVDFLLNIAELQKLFPSYNEIVFKNIDYIGSQVFFNAIYSKTKVTIDLDSKTYFDKLESLFKGNNMFSAVKRGHTCLHRTKTLLNALKLNEYANSINEVIERL